MFEHTTKKVQRGNIPNNVVQRLPLADTIYYGRWEQRRDYAATKKLVAGKHYTVDTLNHTIGFDFDCAKTNKLVAGGVTSNNFMGFQGLPLGRKRTAVNAVLSQNQAKYHQDEKDWIDWLSKPNRKNALLMDDIDAKDCRRDEAITVNDTAEIKPAPDGRRISRRRSGGIGPFNLGSWKEENYSVNIPLAKPPANDITPIERNLHNQLVNNNVANSRTAETTLANDHIQAPHGNTILAKTRRWLNNIGIRFWRFTSLMGLDFFKDKGKKIEFVRDGAVPNNQVYRPAGGAQSITDSEWHHVKEMGYGNRHNTKIFESVKRVDPVP